MRLALFAILLTGCASPTIWANGDLGAGIPLATVQAVDRPCNLDRVAACILLMRVGDVLQAHVYVLDGLAAHQRDAAFAHELCHALAAAQHLTDTCHEQDGGRLR